jgi:hypothetical protein
VNAATLGAYRQPDAARTLAIEEARQAEEAEARRVVAAMKNPLHGLRQSWPRGPGAVGLLLSVASIAVPFLLASEPIVTLAVHANGHAWAALGVLECGCLAGLTGAGFGVVGMVRNESPFASVLAFLTGVCAPVWSLVCALLVHCSG